MVTHGVKQELQSVRSLYNWEEFSCNSNGDFKNWIHAEISESNATETNGLSLLQCTVCSRRSWCTFKLYTEVLNATAFHYSISLIKKPLSPTLCGKYWGVIINKIPLNTVRNSVYSYDVFEGKVLLWRVIFVSFFQSGLKVNRVALKCEFPHCSVLLYVYTSGLVSIYFLNKHNLTELSLFGFYL